MVHSDSGSHFQQLDGTRQALRQQTAAREETERLLADARNTMHDLETKLGHERLARDEVTQRINAERLQLEELLTAMQEGLTRPRKPLASKSVSVRTRCATALPPTCSNKMSIFASSRFYSGTPSWIRPRSTPVSLPRRSGR